ncbi:HNH endonuclease [Streptomyces sp. NPDC057298]|uniref:HNH endonuclease n=1 Tax=Streptomyces sp. NPDC057298 TaxID=3346091 RepID=UPI0036388334
MLENYPVVEVEATDDADEGARARFAYARTLPEEQAHLVHTARVRVSANIIRYPYPKHFAWTRRYFRTQLDARAWTVGRVKDATNLVRQVLLTIGHNSIVLPEGWPAGKPSPPRPLASTVPTPNPAAVEDSAIEEPSAARKWTPVPAPRVPSAEGVRPVPGLLCPVCDKGGLPAGRLRHVRCEGASRTVPEPAAVDCVRWGEEYRRLVATVERREEFTRGRRRAGSTQPVRIAAAREAVILRCGGRCENPSCPGQPDDVTDTGAPILQVDHVNDLARGGRDHPSQMVALCPNCHAVKTLGRTREALSSELIRVAATAHADWISSASPT